MDASEHSLGTSFKRLEEAADTGALDQWNNLNTRYSSVAFIQLLDPNADYSVINALRDEHMIVSASATGLDRTLSLNFNGASYSNKLLQVGFCRGQYANTDWDRWQIPQKMQILQIRNSYSEPYGFSYYQRLLG